MLITKTKLIKKEREKEVKKEKTYFALSFSRLLNIFSGAKCVFQEGEVNNQHSLQCFSRSFRPFHLSRPLVFYHHLQTSIIVNPSFIVKKSSEYFDIRGISRIFFFFFFLHTHAHTHPTSSNTHIRPRIIISGMSGRDHLPFIITTIQILLITT